MPFRSVNGISIYFEESGSGPAVALISGLGSDHRTWTPILPSLAERFRCIVFDNRDSGRSGESPAGYTVAGMAQDVVGLLDALRVRTAHVIGYSMGGAIAQELALGHPERVERLVLISTYTSSDSRGGAILESWLHLQQNCPREVYLRAIYPWLYSVSDYAEPGLIDAVLQYALENPYVQSAPAYERQMRAALSHHAKGRLQSIRSPTLLLFGEEDALTPLRFAEGLLAEIPNVRLKTFSRTGHALVWTRSAEVVAAIREFLIDGD